MFLTVLCMVPLGLLYPAKQKPLFWLAIHIKNTALVRPHSHWTRLSLKTIGHENKCTSHVCYREVHLPV